MMKIIHIVSGDKNSGAFKGAYLLHKGLINQGINSIILNNSSIDQLRDLKNVNTTNNKFYKLFFFKILQVIDKFPKLFFFARRKTTFSSNFVKNFFINKEDFSQFDIVHLHWINKSMLNLNQIIEINKPIVWTFRDMWPFTGGCHYTLECKKYVSKCGNCPQLRSKLSYDLSTILFNYKKDFFKKKEIYLCSVSKWLSEKARKSSILQDKKIFNMHNHVDINSFYPSNKILLKKKYKISNKKIIIFGSENVSAEYKGFDLFLKSLKYLNKKKILILIFGKLWNFEDIKKTGFDYRYLGYLDKKTLKDIYAMGDVFAIPSVQDAFPKTFAEAMLCECPVVAFKKTSISEINLHKKSGYNANYKNPKDFAKGINYVFKNSKKLGKFARKNYLKKYHPNKITKNFIKLYNSILKNNEFNK